MKAVYDAGVKEISRNGTDEKDGFIWPSYVEDIMGPELSTMVTVHSVGYVSVVTPKILPERTVLRWNVSM